MFLQQERYHSYKVVEVTDMHKNVREIRSNSIRLLSRLFCFFIFVIGILWLPPLQAKAVMVHESESGYQALIIDQAGILTESETTRIAELMKPITEYGHITVLIGSEFASASILYAEEYGRNKWGGESGTAILIDPKEKVFDIYNNGYIRRNIGETARKNLVYEYGEYVDEGEYVTCLVMVLDKMNVMLTENVIANPIKSFSYALLALVTAMVVMYSVVDSSMRKHVVSEDEWLRSISIKQDIYNFSEHYLHEDKKYVPGSSKYQKMIDDLSQI